MSLASLRDANGVCLLTAATRLVIDDVVRSLTDACRLARKSDFWVTTDDCAQAASDAAPRATASSRMTFPARAAKTSGASSRVQPALASTYEVRVLPMEHMLQSPARAPAQAEIQHVTMPQPNPGGSVAESDYAPLSQRNSVRVW
jgi:hypothetical protein